MPPELLTGSTPARTGVRSSPTTPVPEVTIGAAIESQYGWNPSLQDDVLAMSGKPDAEALAADPEALDNAVRLVKIDQPGKFLSDQDQRRLSKIPNDNRRFMQTHRTVLQYQDRHRSLERAQKRAMSGKGRATMPVRHPA